MAARSAPPRRCWSWRKKSSTTRHFRHALCDAVESIPVGSAWDLKTKMGPLIRPARGVLETALKELEPGESWAVMPHFSDENPNIVRPAVKWGVQPGSFTHLTEFFGPVLGVMKAKNLEEAIRLVNQTGYGLTSGLESLDDREQKMWIDSIHAGNLYVNRSTTGAIVLRQPFGGMGKSAFGPGIKAGGPNYVAQLMRFRDVEIPAKTASTLDAHLSELVDRLPALASARGDLDAAADRPTCGRHAQLSASHGNGVRMSARQLPTHRSGQYSAVTCRSRNCGFVSIRLTPVTKFWRGCAPPTPPAAG